MRCCKDGDTCATYGTLVNVGSARIGSVAVQRQSQRAEFTGCNACTKQDAACQHNVAKKSGLVPVYLPGQEFIGNSSPSEFISTFQSIRIKFIPDEITVAATNTFEEKRKRQSVSNGHRCRKDLQRDAHCCV